MISCHTKPKYSKMSAIYYSVLSVICLFFIGPGIYGQVTEPPSTAVARGEDVSLVCTSTEANPTFTWTYATNSQPLYIGTTRGTTAERYANIMLQGGTDAQTSILDISDIQLEDEGEYLCSTTATTTPPPSTVVTVEVCSASKEIDLINIGDFANYQATCDAIGSKPEETIKWILDSVTLTDGIVETDPDTSADPLFNKRSVFTFPSSLDNYDLTLVCEISGHQVSSLNRQESRRVNVQNPPHSKGIMIGLNSDGTDLTVSCNTNDAVAAAIPPMDLFYIYSNGTLITKPLSDKTVSVTQPEEDTEFTCVGGNYLGNTTTTTNFNPGKLLTTIRTATESERGTTTRPTESNTGLLTSSRFSTELEGGTTTIPTESNTGLLTTIRSSTESEGEPTPCTCLPTCLSSGASAGIAVLAILLVASVIINIIKFIMLRRHETRPGFEESQKTVSREGRNVSHEAIDNMAFENGGKELPVFR